MKIVAGIGLIDDYIKIVQAGADEMFIGFVPYEWTKKYGSLFPLNRREVLYYNVQVTSYEDMKILKKMIDVYNVPVTITINYPYYPKEQYKIIEDIIEKLCKIGFNEFIIADISLLLYLRERKLNFKVHLSGECAEINKLSIEFLNQFDIKRYIFHRKNSICDMKECIKSNKVKNLEYEAFILNERCHYTGAFCSSLHCDELSHLCKIDYIMAKNYKNSNHFKNVSRKLEKYYEESETYENHKGYFLGENGCGLCSLYNLDKAGVTHLKVVGRGNLIYNIENDVKNLKRALHILKNSQNYKEDMRKELFPDGCSKKCYYFI
ncbi:U32 family peptidase [Clostridium sp. BJN0001]|uniref:U32 family peptidase n=1 Tax=Clostridium sp. BJN0001 TaxID=2930219 RepID=UPI001FD414FD|nr:U32 family peptidase [Clostridium sp. BJN0001]